MRRLADQIKETVKLATISDAELLVLEAVESPYQLHTRGDVGQRAPLYCTGLGKALLASIPEQDIRELVARRGLAPYTARTITSLERLEQEVAQIRINGYALDREENEEGVCCVGVQIRDLSGQTIAAMSISGPTTRLTEQTIPECASLLAAAAKAISQSLR
jgi:DNA-binding IclR family transcriptional regulator